MLIYKRELDQVEEGIQEKIVELRTKSRKHIWCEAKLVYTCNEQDEVVGYTVMLREVSSEVVSKKNYFNWFAHHPSVMLICDPDKMKIIRANKAAERFYGYTLRDAYHVNLEDVILTPVSRFHKKIKEAILDESVKYESKHRKADGTEVDVEVMINRIYEGGRWLVHIVIYDITKKKKAENKVKLLSAAVDQSPVSVIITDTEGMMEYVNAACARISGYKIEGINW